jgi:hypothetical protein
MKAEDEELVIDWEFIEFEKELRREQEAIKAVNEVIWKDIKPIYQILKSFKPNVLGMFRVAVKDPKTSKQRIAIAIIKEYTGPDKATLAVKLSDGTLLTKSLEEVTLFNHF